MIDPISLAIGVAVAGSCAWVWKEFRARRAARRRTAEANRLDWWTVSHGPKGSVTMSIDCTYKERLDAVSRAREQLIVRDAARTATDIITGFRGTR